MCALENRFRPQIDDANAERGASPRHRNRIIRAKPGAVMRCVLAIEECCFY